MTKKQIAALKYLISFSKDGNEIAKQIATYLVNNSNMLTREVHLTLFECERNFSTTDINEAVNHSDAMCSSNLSTHLNQILTAMGTEFRFGLHYGHFEGSEFITAGQFAGLPREAVTNDDAILEGQPLRYTFWFAKERCCKSSASLEVSREILESIDVDNPDLYKH